MKVAIQVKERRCLTIEITPPPCIPLPTIFSQTIKVFYTKSLAKMPNHNYFNLEFHFNT